VGAILVTGGTGTLGSEVVSLLRNRGEEVRVLSRRSGIGTHLGDLTSGRGLAAAADGVDRVVHAASDTRRFGRTDLEQTANLLRATRSVSHVVFVSIVGIDEIPYAYYRKKRDCEHLFETSGIPHTIARATQFHELIAMLLRYAERLPVAPLPLDFSFQSVAAADVATHVVGLLDGEPLGRAKDFGGPDVATLGDMVRCWQEIRGRPRSLVNLAVPGRVARGFRQGRNTCPDHADGDQVWGDFVRGLDRGARPTAT
jgi:uncharacterized protein YbjT (DUF2867 family)